MLNFLGFRVVSELERATVAAVNRIFNFCQGSNLFYMRQAFTILKILEISRETLSRESYTYLGWTSRSRKLGYSKENKTAVTTENEYRTMIINWETIRGIFLSLLSTVVFMSSVKVIFLKNFGMSISMKIINENARWLKWCPYKAIRRRRGEGLCLLSV